MIFIKRFFKILISVSLLILLVFSATVTPLASDSSLIASPEKEASEAAKAEVFEAPISRLKELLDGGAITSKKICEIYLERIEKYDKSLSKLNTVISINTNAVAQAEILDSERKKGNIKGALHGIPILVKDNIDVSGFPTTLGKSDFSKDVATEDAAVVAKLVEDGAIILGKTNLSTNDLVTRYTYSAYLGETRNAYNTAYSAGGSSGGSAVAVSANFAAAALGTDTNFSLLYPAALNGTVALRPTHNLLDYTGCAKVNASRDVVGPITKTVSDAALMLDVMSGNSYNLKYSKALDKNSLKGKKLAVLKELSQYTYNSPNEFKNTDDEILKLFEKAKEDIKAQGGEIVEISIPKLFTYYNTTRESSSGSDSAKAKLLSEIEKALSDSKASAFIFPAYLSSPHPSGFDAGTHKSANLNYLNCTGYFPSLVGLPAIVVPMGMHSCGISTGLEFVSLKNTEAELLSLAYSYEQATLNRKAPDIAKNLYKNGEVILNSSPVSNVLNPENQPEQNDVSTVKSNDFPWQSVAVVIIIVSLLSACSFVLISGVARNKKTNLKHKHRRF